MLVYVAGPYSMGDVGLNVAKAIDVGEAIAALGHTPIVPHLNHLWHLKYPHPYQFWMEIDKELIPHCSCVLRIPGPSAGADTEVEFAKHNGLRTFDSWRTFEDFARRIGADRSE